MTVDEIFHLATIRGPHAGSGCACNQCRQAEALGVAVQEIERLRTNHDHSCTCPHGDASEPLRNHDRACPIRINKMKRIAPEVALEWLARALDDSVKIDALHEALKEAIRMAHPATAGSYTDDHKREECERLTKTFAL